MMRWVPAFLLLASCASSEKPDSRPRVLFFITTDCPIANSFAPEIKRIITEYGPRGVDFTMVYTDLSQPPEAAKRHADEYGYKTQVLVDQGRVQCRTYGITVTPEAIVLDRRGHRVYRGRIDDRYLAPGQYRLVPTTREVRDAIEAVLAGRPVPVAETTAAGCPLTD